MKAHYNYTEWLLATPNITKQVNLVIPYDHGLSKNSSLAFNSKNKTMYVKPNVKKLKTDLILELKSKITPGVFYVGKIWIDLLVIKPNSRCDAINFVDVICDCVKVAINIDDKYFSLRKVDWIINKEQPEIFISIGQEKL